MEDETLFIKFFGTENPVLRVLDFLIDNEAFEQGKPDCKEVHRAGQSDIQALRIAGRSGKKCKAFSRKSSGF